MTVGVISLNLEESEGHAIYIYFARDLGRFLHNARYFVFSKFRDGICSVSVNAMLSTLRLAPGFLFTSSSMQISIPGY
jgi:hypothetical protein